MTEITGRHVFIGFAIAFGIIISVNLTLAFNAVKTFPGLKVDNSYVASQKFEDMRQEQNDLGWTVHSEIFDGLLVVKFTDKDGALSPRIELARIGRPTHVKEDIVLDLTREGDHYVAAVDLARGQWILDLKARAEDGTMFQQTLSIWVALK